MQETLTIALLDFAGLSFPVKKIPQRNKNTKKKH
jgi:hypothetical protein